MVDLDRVRAGDRARLGVVAADDEPEAEPVVGEQVAEREFLRRRQKPILMRTRVVVHTTDCPPDRAIHRT